VSWWRGLKRNDEQALQPDTRHEQMDQASPSVDPTLAQRWITASRSSQSAPSSAEGEAITEAERQPLESAFQHDLGDVRVHRDEDAAQLAEQQCANAFTTGRDIYFARGAYSTALLAHELGHVVQQSRASSLAYGEDSFLERQAESASAAAMSGLLPEMGSGGPVPAMQRQTAPGGSSPTSPKTTPMSILPTDSLTVEAFDIDKSMLSGTQKQKLDLFAERLKNTLASAPDTLVTVVGYADAPGTEPHNLALGQQRAESVRDYLVGKGIPSAKLHATSLGEAMPAVPGKSYEAKNRRVEINLLERNLLKVLIPMTPSVPLVPPPVTPPPVAPPKIDLTYRPNEPTPDEEFQEKFKRVNQAVREAQAEEAAHPGTSVSDASGRVLRSVAAKLGLPKWLQDRAESLGKDLPAMGAKAIIDRIAGERGIDAQTQNALKAAVDAMSQQKIK
jgi:outer membrane protein OmpA-like peptidoglycan-associated protein